MRIRNAIATGVGAALGAAGAHRVLQRRAGSLGPPLDRQMGSYRWRGMTVKYTEAGDPEAPDVVLFHSIHPAGSSREFHRIFDDLTESYHVLAPDFPGFGCSDRPPLNYSTNLYQSFVRDFLTDHSQSPNIIASGGSGHFITPLEDGRSLGQIVLICPSNGWGPTDQSYQERILRLPLFGTSLFNMYTSRIAIRHMFQTYAIDDPDALTAPELEYFWQTAHQPGARFAPAARRSGALSPHAETQSRLRWLDANVTILWGRKARAPPIGTGRKFAEAADAKLVVIDNSRAWPHFEQPAAVLSLLTEEFLRTRTG